MTILSENLKALRERAGYSIRKLSSLSGVSKSVISEIENGRAKKPRYETLEKLSTALNVSIVTLTGMEIEHEYIVTDIEEALTVILNQNDLTLDGVELIDEAKTQLSNAIKMGIQFARDIQSKQNNKIEGD